MTEWLRLVRFLIVGGSGYVVNLLVFTAVFGATHKHLLAAVCAFMVAVANNFWWNRQWTFADSGGGLIGVQAVRFLIVSLCAFGVSVVVLHALVATHAMEASLAQAVAIAVATPVNFLGQRAWSFAMGRRVAPES